MCVGSRLAVRPDAMRNSHDGQHKSVPDADEVHILWEVRSIDHKTVGERQGIGWAGRNVKTEYQQDHYPKTYILRPKPEGAA